MNCWRRARPAIADVKWERWFKHGVFGPSPVSQRLGGGGETGDARSTYAAKRPVFSVRTPRASSNDVRT
jgi:hypothetical protein